MKTLYTIILSSVVLFTLTAQKLEVGFGTGSGKTFIVEDAGNNTNFNYNVPFSMFGEIAFVFEDSFFNLKLRGQYVYSGIKSYNNLGNDFVAQRDYVNSYTTYLLVEHLKSDKNWNFGYSTGFGLSRESSFVQLSQEGTYGINTQQFMNFLFSGMVSKRISNSLKLTIEPTIIWSDVVGTFGRTWQARGEDINALLQVGMRYRF